MTGPVAGTASAETGLRSWGTEQLAAFLGAVSAPADDSAAIRAGLERIAETFEAEVAAVVSEEGVEASCGFAGGRTPASQVLEVAAGERDAIDLDGIGDCGAIAVRSRTSGCARSCSGARVPRSSTRRSSACCGRCHACSG